jgi:hypothetical protein
MKSVLIFVIGFAIAVYLGGYVCFYGGIVQIIDALNATPANSVGIAIGIIRVLVTMVVFWATVAISLVVSAALS